MSQEVDQSFIRQYEDDVHDEFQRKGGFLRPLVRMKTNVVGKSTTFQKVGQGTATEKQRHGEVTPMNQSHTPIECTLADFYAGDYVDRLDEAKTNIDERGVIARGGAMALGRKVDSQIITALDGTTQSAVTLNVTSKANILASVLTWIETLWGNDIDNDGQNFGIITPRLESQFSLLEEYASCDYVKEADKPYVNGVKAHGQMKYWKGIYWQVHNGCPGRGTTTAKGFVWNMNAVGYATGKHAGNIAENEAVAADVQWVGPRVSHWINHMMSGGACLIDDKGVIEGTWNDTTAIATT